jgi:hypothetical protein
MVIDGRESECMVKLYQDYHGYELWCNYDVASRAKFSFTDQLKMIKNTPQTFSATDINNSIGTLPQINEFNLTSNRYINESNQSEIDPFYRDGKSTATIRLSEKLDENQTAHLFFHRSKVDNISGRVNLISFYNLKNQDLLIKLKNLLEEVSMRVDAALWAVPRSDPVSCREEGG